MNTDEPQDDLSTDDELDAQRNIIRQSLDAIIDEIGIAMRDVRLTSGAKFSLVRTVNV